MRTCSYSCVPKLDLKCLLPEFYIVHAVKSQGTTSSSLQVNDGAQWLQLISNTYSSKEEAVKSGRTGRWLLIYFFNKKAVDCTFLQ